MISTRSGSARRVVIVLATAVLGTGASLVFSTGAAGATTTRVFGPGTVLSIPIPVDVDVVTVEATGASGGDTLTARGGEGGQARATVCIGAHRLMWVMVGGRGGDSAAGDPAGT